MSVMQKKKKKCDGDTQQLVGSTTYLYLDQGNHNVLFLNRLFFPLMQHGKKCCLSPSVFCLTYSLFIHLLTSRDSFTPPFVIFTHHLLAFVSLICCICCFFSPPWLALFPLWSSFASSLSGNGLLRIFSSSSAAGSEAHLPQEKPSQRKNSGAIRPEGAANTRGLPSPPNLLCTTFSWGKNKSLPLKEAVCVCAFNSGNTKQLFFLLFIIFKLQQRRGQLWWGREGGMHIQWSHDLLADKTSIALFNASTMSTLLRS